MTIRTTRGYPGSKGGNGVHQQIIAQIPPHDLFIEAFAGSAQVLKRMRPSPASVAIDRDPSACDALKAFIDAHSDLAGVNVICGDALVWLAKNRSFFRPRTVVYCDPPYLADVRSRPGRRYYAHEFDSPDQHEELLELLLMLTGQGVRCLVSGYRSPLYDRWLQNWRRVDYQAVTRGGPVTESLWCSFEQPRELHDYLVLGRNFRERERIKRKKGRWVRRLGEMDDLERAAVLAAIDEYRGVGAGSQISTP